MELLADQLRRSLTETEPFGPVDHADFAYAEAATAEICTFVPALRNPLEHRSSIIIGRRGSGKSTYLSTFEMGDHLRVRLRSEGLSKAVASSKKQIVLPLKTWALFNQIVGHLKQIEASTLVPVALIPPEQVEEYWIELLWDKIIEAAYEDILEAGLSSYPAIRTYFDASPPKMSRSAALQKDDKIVRLVIANAMEDVVKYFRDKNLKVVIALDNFEKYPVRTPEYQSALQGFVRAIAHFQRHVPGRAQVVFIVFALPEEIESTISITDATYANVLKDTARSARIRWKPGHLWAVALHRFRLFMRLNDDVGYSKVKEILLDRRDGRKRFLDMLFTGCVTNGRGAEEQPENYIIRHTQLLPRHLLTLLNGIVANHLSGKGDCLGIPPDSVIAGVREKEEYLAQDVLTPYTWVYPNLVSAMRPVLSELGHCFDFGELDKRLPRIVRDSGEDFDLHNRAQIWLLLHGMGVIGLQNGVDEKRSYVESIFHYNTLDAK